MEIAEVDTGENESDKALPPITSSPSPSRKLEHDNGRFMSSCLLVTQGVIVYAHLAVLTFLVVRVHSVVDDVKVINSTFSTPKPTEEDDRYNNEKQKVFSRCHGILFTFAAFILTIIIQELYIRAEKESKLKATIDLIFLASTYTLLLLITMYQLKHSMIYDHFGLFYLFILAYFAVTLLMTLIYVARLCNKMRRLGRNRDTSQ